MHSSFALRIHRTILNRALLNSGDRILVGVSGGADSVALARVLRELGYDIGIAHLNHALRGAESNADERFVAELASGLNAPFYFRIADIRMASGNTEEAGRKARREFFERIQAERGFSKVALGHTRDDRNETFLLNLVRGAGLEGLVSMQPMIGAVVRPLIDIGRSDVESYLRGIQQPWRTDSTNIDLRFVRNRMRHQFIPDLMRYFNPRFPETLRRTVDVLDEENAWMQVLAREWLSRHGQERAEGTAMNADALRAAPVALARRVIREGIRMSGIPLTGVTFGHIDVIRALAELGKSGKTAELPGGVVVRREFDWILVVPQVAPVDSFAYDLPIPGAVRAPLLKRIFRAFIVDSAVDSAQQHVGAVFVDGERLGPYVRIRPWQPGDYYRPAGRPAGKLKKLFQQARIPRSQRRGWPVFVTDAGIVWVASFPVSREFVPCERSQKIVALEALSDAGEFSG